MQKIRVTVSCELEIPDDWKILPPSEDDEEHLVIDERFFRPDIMWMEYKGKDAGGCETWEETDDEIFELINDHTVYGTECSIERIEHFTYEEE